MTIELIDFLQVLWLLLPAAFANMAAFLFNLVPFLESPISARWFGGHKTYRGFFFGIVVAIVIAQIQNLSVPYVFANYAYASANPWILGVLLGFGALFGDLIKSFFKRRAHVKPGKPWAPWDQIDWILGALIFLNAYVLLDWKMSLLALLVFSLLHPLVNYLGYLFRMKKNKF